MNSSELKNLIKLTDSALNQYASKFNNIVKPIESVFFFGTHNTNEFTNVYVAKKEIENYLTAYQGCKIAVRELPITYSYSNSIIQAAKAEALNIKKHSKSFKKDGYFSVDSYFDVDITVSSNDKTINNTHIKSLFVEYKSSDIFKYLLLADDFIKYKIYTCYHEDDTCFVFINFDKNPNYPSILKRGLPEYFLLPRLIKKSLFSRDDHVFIYIPRKTAPSKILPLPLYNLKKIYHIIHEVESAIETIDEKDLEEKKHFALINDFYVDNIGAFKSGVATAEILLDCYYFFIKPIFDILKEKIPINEFNKYLLEMVKKGFFNYEKEVYGDKKNRSLNEGLNSGYKSSLNLLVLFNYLNTKYNLGLKPHLKSFESESARGKTTIDYNKILLDNTNYLIEYASQNDYMEGLALNALSFIHNLYQRIFNFDSNGEYSYKEEYLLMKKSNKLQKLINELSGILNIKKEFNMFSENIKHDCESFFEKTYALLNGEEEFIG